MAVPTIADIARRCGVSPATVSKALSPFRDRCDLSPATRERIIAAAEAMGWRRDAAQSRRARREAGNVGLMWGRLAPFTDGVYDQLIELLATRLAAHGRRALFVPAPDARAWTALQMAQRLDGVIALPPLADAVLAELEASDYPAVLLNLASPRRLHQVLADDRGGAAALAAHLAGLGHRRMVYMPARGSDPHDSEELRRAGLADAAAAHGVRLDITASKDLAAVLAACRDGASAVVCYDFNDVPRTLAALAEAGLRVPDRVSLACTSDVAWFQHLSPAVTAAVVPMQAMAEAAVDLLAGLLERGDGGERQVCVLGEELRVRASTAPAPSSR